MSSRDMDANNSNDEPMLSPSGLDSPIPPGSEPTTIFTGSQNLAALGPMQPAFGDYELLAEVGRGGMGVVYRAKQKTLNRIVALKMILGGRLASADDLHRFLIEARAAARLHHRHIATVHEIGEIQGQYYFSMEYVEGETLARRLASGPMPSRKAARIMLTVAQALQYAHEQGILHRDLKPSNIMIDKNDEPYVTDFGLAKRLDADATHKTQTGAVLGTPSYMSPEQASAKIKEVGPATDIYGMGAVLYELLTGRPPFRSETPLDTLMHVLHSEPVPPRLLNPKVDADLETICMKCLEKDPKSRYASATDLGKDLQRYLNGESIRARSFTMLDRIGRMLDRSQHDAAFHAWSSMLFLIAGIVFIAHLAVFLIALTPKLPQSPYFFLVARAGQFVLLGLIFWFHRGDQILPRTSAERELWTIWIGYVIAYGASFAVVRVLIDWDIVVAGPGAPVHWDNLVIYPISSVLTGLAFFVMGSNYWGRCYAVGMAFMMVAIITSLFLLWSPLVFGILWATVLCSLGFRLRGLGTRAEEEKQNFFTQETLTANKEPARQ